MINWFLSLDQASQIAVIVAVITFLGGILTAVVNGLFGLVAKKRDNASPKYVIKQTAHDNATQIGIQFSNKKEDE